MLSLTKWRSIPCFGKQNAQVLVFDEESYRRQAEEALLQARELLQSEGWQREKSDADFVVYAKCVPRYGKIFKLVGSLPFPPEKVIEELFFKMDKMHNWNPTVKKVKLIEKIDKHLDVVHVIASEGASGLVASRDFVNVRILKHEADGFVHGTVGTTHAEVPPDTKYVRGEQGPGIYLITRGPKASSCQLQWLLSTNLKGWIPQYLIDQTLSSVMLDYILALRAQCAKSA